MNSGTSATAKKVAKPAARRRVYMDFATQGKKPAMVTGGVSTAQKRVRQPVRLRPDARAAQANARIAQRKAQAEAQQRAMRLAKAGVPGRAPGLEKPVVRSAKPAAQKKFVAKPAAAQKKFVAKPAATPEPQRPLSRGRVVKPRGAVARYSGATVADAQAAVARTETVQVTDTPAGRLVEQESFEEIDFGVVEDYQSGSAGAATEVTPEATKVPEKGSNWPFLKSVTVEKRPLSGKKPVPTKTVAPRPTTVTPAASSIALNSGVAKKGSKLPMVGLILLTIILGVAVGAAVYFAIFQGGGPEA